MGADEAGNRYYENKVDYPLGQHRWVEPGDMNNFDSSSVAPEWHGWMCSMNDAAPATEDEFIADRKQHFVEMEHSDANVDHNVGHQEPFFNFHGMHDQSQMRSRGYNIGNPIVNLPPGAPDAYYTQPGSPYNPASIRKLEFIGDLDESKGGGRPYKSQKWADRLQTADEKAAVKATKAMEDKKMMSSFQEEILNRQVAARGRGAGTVVGK
jgi:NADH:ubiquinone oxidoreductase subunit